MHQQCTNVIAWNSAETVKCPAGSFGRHRVWGRVSVLSALGWKRLVETRRHITFRARGGEWMSVPGRTVLVLDVHELEREAG